MRLPNHAHTSRPWRVHEFTDDFDLEDVWKLEISGGPGDLERLVRLVVSLSAGHEYPAAVRALFALRWRLGALFGWDDVDAGVGERVPSLRERLPADLLAGPRGPDLHAVPGRDGAPEGPPIFVSLYQTHDEWLTEYASETVHSLMHIGWVRDGAGDGHHAQMAVLVRPNGWLGRAYMAAIKPFRYAIYPMQLRAVARLWHAPARARRVRVSDPAATGRRWDYADAFELWVDGSDRRPPEEWVRAGVDATSAWMKRLAGHPDGIGSARVVESDASAVVLEDSDPWMDTVMIGRNLEDGRRMLTTVLRFRRPLLARALWTVIGMLHRRAARRLVAGGSHPAGPPRARHASPRSATPSTRTAAPSRRKAEGGPR